MRVIFSRMGRRRAANGDPPTARASSRGHSDRPLRPGSLPAHRLATILAMIASAAFLACSDYFSAPKRSDPPPLQPTSRATTDAYPKESPASQTLSITINDSSGFGSSGTYAGPTYSFTTIVKAVAAGTVTRTPLSGLGSVTTYGPVGATGLAWTWQGYNSAGFDTSATRYVRFEYGSQGLVGMRTNYGMEHEQDFGPNHIWCGLAGYPLCATFSGSATITLTRLESSLSLIADSTNVMAGSTVRFTATANPAVVEGQTMPVQVDSSWWTPDAPPSGEPTDTIGNCGFGLRGYTCLRQIIGSGTFHVVAYVNGKRQEGQIHITTPALTLTANPVAVKKGANVTFTPNWSDGHAVTAIWSWQWIPDGPPPGATGICFYYDAICTRPLQENGTMKIQVRPNGVIRFASAHAIVYTNLTLDADRSAVHAGDTVTFTPKYDGVPGPAARWRFAPSDTSVHENVACGNGISPCRKAMVTTGQMWVYTATSGGDSASAPVTVVAGRITLAGGGTFNEGDLATFTAGSSGRSLVVTGWFWDPTSGGAPNRLLPKPPRLGSIQAPRSVRGGFGASRRSLDTSPEAPCSPGNTTCTDTVNASGKMWVYGTVDGAADSISVPVDLAPKIKLICTPKPVQRASSPVTCTATATGGTLAVTGWTFTPSPAILDTTQNAITIIRANNPTSTQWSGLIVTPGTVIVRGSVGGTTATPGIDTLRVNDRDNWFWTGMTSKTNEVPGNYECSDSAHYQAHKSGWTTGPRCGIQTWIFTPHILDTTNKTTFRGIFVSQVPDGPNTGLWFVDSVSVKLALHVQALKDWRSDGHEYAYTSTSDSATNAQCPGSANAYRVNSTCKSNASFDLWFAHLWRHENCHMTIAVVTFDSLPDARVLAERVVRPDSLSTKFDVAYQTNGLYTASTAIIQASDTLDKLPGSPYTQWRYDPQLQHWNSTPVTSFDAILPSVCQ